MKSFWQQLPKPFTVLAPMEGVTDIIFRQIISEIGKPEVLFTEFTSCAGLLSKGAEKVRENLEFTKAQKPVVAQIWGTEPQEFYEVSKSISKLGFSGIDINMGCPVRAVVKHGACGGLLKTPEKAVEIVKATIRGAGNLPVSVKTRIGYSEIDINSWIGILLEQQIDALTVHLRTVSEMSKVKAHWELMPEIIKLRDKISPKTVIIGNGDLKTLNEIAAKYSEYKNEGFMIGTGIFSNPWLFNKDINIEAITIPQRIKLFLHHIELFEEKWHGERNFAHLKKFAKTYISNFPDAAGFRDNLMESKNIADLKNLLINYNLKQ